MAQATLDGFQKTCGLDVSGRHLDADDLVVLLDGRVGSSVVVVDEAGDLLSETMANIAKLLVVAVDFVWVVAVGTLASVHFKVVGWPALGGVHWARDRDDGVRVEANHSILLG